MKQSILRKYLISEIYKKKHPSFYVVDVLAVDESLNMATKTGIGSTIYIPDSALKTAMAEHGLKTVKSMVGFPVTCKTVFEGGNVLGSSSFHSMG